MKKVFNWPVVVVLVAMFAMNFLDGRFSDPKQWLISMLEMMPGIIIGLSFHEFGHAFVADRLGDDTPKAQGRVTLNPLAHIDPIGFIALIFCGFGWGVPVQINPYNFKHQRRDHFFVALAGVVMNLLLVIIFAFALRFLIRTQFSITGAGTVVTDMVVEVILINIVLMVFNLMPIPPLDGFNIVTEIFDLRRFNWYWQVYDKGFIILLALLFFNILEKVMTPTVSGIWSLIYQLIIL